MDQIVSREESDEVVEDSEPSWKNRLRVPLLIIGPVLLLLVIGYFYFTGGRYQSTSDAYVQAAQVLISANVDGRVQKIEVHDNELVHRGDVLFRLDDSTFRIGVTEAEAQEQIATLQIATLKANYRQRLAEQKSAQETLAFRRSEFERQKRLLSSGIASQLQLDSASHAMQEASAQVATTDELVAAAKAALQGDPDIKPENHPTVAQARARLDRAKLDLSYTTVRAPSDGIVTRVEDLQVGSYIKASAPLFALVANSDLWVEANFKEDQLAYLRAGQRATIEIDRYPGTHLTGKVVSLSPGTGSQFSVLPAENATGNWIKVVQRVPVRIQLDKLDPSHPLQSGLSAEVNVDTGHSRLASNGGATANDPGSAAGEVRR